mgnify:CR=1 FL=1
MAYGNLNVDVVQSSTAGTPTQFNDGNGTQVGTLCRAWVNYKGTATRAINASFNVSSVTFNATGDYTVNFTNAFSDSNYAPTFGTVPDNTAFAGSVRSIWVVTQTTTTTQVRMGAGNPAAAADFPNVFIAFFR